MKLSVLLPCFNGAATIGEQLEALTRQNWPGGWEVIVVNNGSTDDSMAIVERYRGRLPDLRIVEAHVPGTPRKGVPHSYNTGIAAATGDAFAFCEADDVVGDGWLEAMGRALVEHPFVVARLEHRKLNPEWVHPPQGDGYQYAGIYRNHYFPFFQSASAAGFGLQRTLYLQLGPLSNDFPIAHDSEYCWRAQAAGYALHFEPAAVVHYREKTDFRSRYRQGRNWGRDSVRMQMHYGSPVGSWPALRQLVWIGRTLPGGVTALIASAARLPNGRRRLADWVWNMGWSVGKFEGLAGRKSVPLRVPAPGVARAE